MLEFEAFSEFSDELLFPAAVKLAAQNVSPLILHLHRPHLSQIHN
jgi:hypothetical protein